MKRALIAAAALVAATAPVVVGAGTAARAADTTCTPTITMEKPFQDPGGFIVFPASYTLCETSRVTVKFRDRDDPATAGSGYATTPAGTGSTYGGTCDPDGAQHRWAAYATIKTPTGTLLVKSATVYFKSKAVKRNCTPYPA